MSIGLQIGLMSLPIDVLRHFVFPHLEELDVLKSCKGMWNMRFKFKRFIRSVAAMRALRNRGRNIRAVLSKKIRRMRIVEKHPMMYLDVEAWKGIPDIFDLPLLSHSPDVRNPNMISCSETLKSDRERFFTLSRCVVTCVRFSETVPELVFRINSQAHTMTNVRELRFQPALPIDICGFTDFKLETSIPIDCIEIEQHYLTRTPFNAYILHDGQPGLRCVFTTNSGDAGVLHIEKGCCGFGICTSMDPQTLRELGFLTIPDLDRERLESVTAMLDEVGLRD